jgi:hypothetical protein
MIEVRLEHTIITFDGTVIEAFPQGQQSSRYHVANVKTATIVSDRKGRQSLQIMMEGGGGIVTGVLSPEAAQQSEALVAEIEKVRGSL